MPDIGDIEVLRLAAFTERPSGGNPAGVVLGARLPDDAGMQRIATEVGYSETAFLAARGDGSYAVRYFSPAAEVDFCGHATIAAGVALGRRDGPGRYLMHTNAGQVPVDVAEASDGRLLATLTSVAPRHRLASPAVLGPALAALRWSGDDLDHDLPPAEAFAGAWHLVLAVRSAPRSPGWTTASTSCAPSCWGAA